MKRFLFAAGLIAALAGGPATAEEIIPVWNGVAPGSEGWNWSESTTVSPTDHTGSIRNVVTPTITVHRPTAPANGTAVLVVPGGGFRSLAWGKEGDAIAEWLNSFGVTAFVLKYRLARTEPGVDMPPQERIEAAVPLAIADGREAMHIIKKRAAEWGVDPARVGAMGFSAGGLIVLALGSDADASVRPAFVAAIYPAEPRGMTVPASAPPLFIAYATDDPHVPLDGLSAAAAWAKAKASVELHLYAKGGHGFGLRKQGLPVNSWDARFIDWMKWAGFLPKP